MKPAYEPIILARKPGPMRELGIEECRIAHNEECRMLPDQHGDKPGNFYRQGGRHGETLELKPSGRWPANLILECTCEETREGTAHSNSHESVRNGIGILKHGGENARPQHADTGGATIRRGFGSNGKEPVRVHTDPNCPCAMLDGQTGTTRPGHLPRTSSGVSYFGAGKTATVDHANNGIGDSGGASRFFYNAKAPRSERWGYCRTCATAYSPAERTQHSEHETTMHPTQKPEALMRWLVKLVARPGDVVVDPFAGSGTTGVACVMEGREFIGVERELDYVEIARRRIDHASAQGMLPLDESPPLGPVAGRPT